MHFDKISQSFMSSSKLSLCCFWQIRMLILLLVVFGLLAIVVAGSLQILDRTMRWIFVGLLSGASLISMFASPLFIIVSISQAFAYLL